ncbi:MAG: hypothetical protein HQ536_05225 [Parcubacteria group bacterium]|nr:hypothetical protein [Parcubacteria group bacterium]
MQKITKTYNKNTITYYKNNVIKKLIKNGWIQQPNPLYIKKNNKTAHYNRYLKITIIE